MYDSKVCTCGFLHDTLILYHFSPSTSSSHPIPCTTCITDSWPCTHWLHHESRFSYIHHGEFGFKTPIAVCVSSNNAAAEYTCWSTYMLCMIQCYWVSSCYIREAWKSHHLTRACTGKHRVCCNVCAIVYVPVSYNIWPKSRL